MSGSYADALKPDEAYKTRQGIYSGLVFGFSQFAIFCTFALVFYAGIELMVAGKVSFVDFFTALLAIMFAAFGVGQTNADFASKKRGLTAAARIFAIVDEPLDKGDPLSQSGLRPDSFNGSVSFESITFSYPSRPDTKVYYPSDDHPDGFTLRIPPKQSCACTGRSGCGKSTALQLLLRFYDVSEGSVQVDNRDVQDLNMSWLRGNIGYVGQQPVLFQGSARSNILLGKPDATEEELIKATKAANAHEFILKLSDGYDTDIGAGGSLLSGGQKQVGKKVQNCRQMRTNGLGLPCCCVPLVRCKVPICCTHLTASLSRIFAARGDCPRHYQGPQNPGPRRGDVGFGQ